MRNPIFAIAGHNIRFKGAKAASVLKGFEWEHDYTTDLQGRIVSRVQHAVCLEGTSMLLLTDEEENSNSQVVDFINRNAGPNSCGFDLHLNNDNPRATGTEVILHPNTSLENKRRATWVVMSISDCLGIPHRMREPGRAWIHPDETFVGEGRLPILEKTKIPMAIYEICFANVNDLMKYIDKRDEVASIIKDAYFLKSFK